MIRTPDRSSHPEQAADKRDQDHHRKSQQGGSDHRVMFMLGAVLVGRVAATIRIVAPLPIASPLEGDTGETNGGHWCGERYEGGFVTYCAFLPPTLAAAP
jgi:hypothetical protein